MPEHLLHQPGSAGEHRLQQAYGSTERAERFYRDQVLDHLNARMREFVARQEMAFVASSDAHGECDASFRAGPPGFLHVIDERTLAYPEYRGNGVMASLGNISENGHVGLLLVDFVHDLIGLHVNGRARIVSDAALRPAAPGLPLETAPGRRAEHWVLVDIEEAYLHCAKHIPRFIPAPAPGPGAPTTYDARAATSSAPRKPADKESDPASSSHD